MLTAPKTLDPEGLAGITTRTAKRADIMTIELIEKQQIEAIDGRKCENKWIESGRDPDHLSRFLKKYPAAFHLSWVKEEIARWGARSEFDNLKLLQPGRGERKLNTGLRKVFIDFPIYQAVTEKLKQGHTLAGENGACLSLTRKSFAGEYFSWEHIRDRYYRFIQHKAVIFIDDGEKMIFGPGRVSFEINGEPISIICIAEYEPKDGFELIKPE